MTGSLHEPRDSDLGHTIRRSCGHWITHTRDSYEAALLRHAGHVRHVTPKTGAQR